MSADGVSQDRASALSEALLAELAASTEVQSLLGKPARLYTESSRGASYPYVLLERHETSDASASMAPASEHVLQFASFSRHGGLAEAKSILGALRTAVETLPKALAGQRIVLVLPFYCDAMRTQNPLIFRGVLRVRLYTEEL